MATSTFDKRIVLNCVAAERMAKAFEDSIKATRPNMSKEKEESEKAWKKLLARCHEESNCFALSEPSLASDWLTQEEDEFWRNL